MTTGVLAIFLTLLLPVALIFWNKMRVKGKVLGHFVKKDKSLDVQLCPMKGSFVFYSDLAYDIYPDTIRLVRFPSGWPPILQELVPSGLWDEENAIPLDWNTLEPFKEGARKLRATLGENVYKKIVQETGRQEGIGGINWRRVLPIGLLILGGGGLVMILIMRMAGG